MITFERSQLVKEKITRLIAIDLSKQQALDAGANAIQQINFIANLEQDENTSMFSLLKK